MRSAREQSGVVLLLVIIILGVGALLLVPTLNYARTALKFSSVSQESTAVQHALDAITQQALWMMEYYDDSNPNFDCNGDLMAFADCVAQEGAWYLTTQPLPTATPQTLVDQVNNQDVTVSVEVPGELAATPTPSIADEPQGCISWWVDRDPTWVLGGEEDPVTYTIWLENCGGATRYLRRLVAVLDPPFNYVTGSTRGSLWEGPPQEPGTVARCTGFSQPYAGCKTGDNSLLVAWPAGDDIFKIALDPGAPRNIKFKAWPDEWGIHYVTVGVCYFAASASSCDDEINQVDRKVAPVVTGMFNIQGRGKGHAYGASSKLDSGGSDLISQQPE